MMNSELRTFIASLINMVVTPQVFYNLTLIIHQFKENIYAVNKMTTNYSIWEIDLLLLPSGLSHVNRLINIICWHLVADMLVPSKIRLHLVTHGQAAK